MCYKINTDTKLNRTGIETRAVSESIGHIKSHGLYLYLLYPSRFPSRGESQNSGLFKASVLSARIHGVISQTTGLLKVTLLVLNKLEYFSYTLVVEVLRISNIFQTGAAIYLMASVRDIIDSPM
jgi:hypothetical protein